MNALAPRQRPGARWALFALFVVATVLRLPRVVFEGRFWAEEARVYYFHAALTAWPEALVYSWAGYLNAGANLAAVAARHLVPLEAAPRVTLLFAFIAQLCPAILLVTSRAAWLRSPLALAACLLLLAAAPSGEEVWLNTLHSQFFLGLATALILAMDTESGGQERFRRVLLVLAPLYGLVAIILWPLLALRAGIERTRPRALQCAALGAGAAVQLALFFQFYADRQHPDTRLILATVFAKNLLLPALGFEASQPTATWLHAALDQATLPPLVGFALAGAALALAWLLSRGPKAAVWLMLACGTVTIVSYSGALQPSAFQVEPHLGGRYAFVPQVLAAWSLVALAAGGLGTRATIAVGLATWLCVASISCYLHPAAVFTTGPSWREEMARWHADPLYSPQAWPGGMWVVPMPLARSE